jgi:hypothetical protein
MARFQLLASHVFGGIKVTGGKTIADTAANAVSGDVVVGALTSSSVTGTMRPLDAPATALKSGSQYSATQMPCSIDGVNSIGG